jgi:hypothetical protein
MIEKFKVNEDIPVSKKSCWKLWKEAPEDSYLITDPKAFIGRPVMFIGCKHKLKHKITKCFSSSKTNTYVCYVDDRNEYSLYELESKFLIFYNGNFVKIKTKETY